MGVTRIDALTDEQTAAMAPYAEKCITAALEVRPTDRAYVTEGIRLFYGFANREWFGDEHVVWVESPSKVAHYGPTIAQLIEEGMATADAIDATVNGGVRRPEAIRANWNRYLGGSMWASWSASTGFFREVCELELPGNLWDIDRAYAQAMSAGWWWPHTNFVVISDRHTGIERDNQGRLHCTTGPAIQWGDGYALYSLDGITVPEWVVMAPDAARIMSEELPNTEQRRVAMAHFGWDKAVDALGLTVIDEHPDPKLGTLYRMPSSLLEDEQTATLLVAENASPDMDGTYRRYGLLASGDAKTVIEAQASIAQVSVEEFMQLDGAS